MVNLSRLSFLYLCILFLFPGCEKKNKEVKIRVRTADLKSVKITANTTDLINLKSTVLAETTTDSLGNATLEFKVDHMLFGSIEVSGKWAFFIVSPGDHMEITMGAGETPGIAYDGDGAKANEYLRTAIEIKEKYELQSGKASILVGPEEFLVRRDSLREAYARLEIKLADESQISEETKAAIRSRLNIVPICFDQNYAQAHYPGGITNPDMPTSIKKAIEHLPYDSIAFKTNLFEYGSLFLSYLQSDIYRPLYQQNKEMNFDSLQKKMAALADNKIRSADLHPAAKEFLRAAQADFWVRMYGLSPEVEAVRESLRKSVNQPAYLATIDKSFAKWYAIGPGKPAPDFTGTTADGKEFSLSDLKGKVVYVDVWATWCGPCRAEFPSSKKLARHFEGNNKIAFLYVSIDDDREVWKKLLPDESIPKGVHINQVQQQQPGNIMESYLIWGIPRYLVVNADGTIQNADAPRPSDPATINNLNEVLRNNLSSNRSARALFENPGMDDTSKPIPETAAKISGYNLVLAAEKPYSNANRSLIHFIRAKNADLKFLTAPNGKIYLLPQKSR